MRGKRLSKQWRSSRRVCEVAIASILDRDSESIIVSIASTFGLKAATEHTESVAGTREFQLGFYF